MGTGFTRWSECSEETPRQIRFARHCEGGLQQYPSQRARLEERIDSLYPPLLRTLSYSKAAGRARRDKIDFGKRKAALLKGHQLRQSMRTSQQSNAKENTKGSVLELFFN